MEKYDSPFMPKFETTLDSILSDAGKEFDDVVYNAVLRCGVIVDRQKLIQALEQDKERYESAFIKGYEQKGSEIVRCKDCKHRPELKLYSDRQGNYTAVEFPDGSKCPCQCEDFFYSWYPKDDWFCADGERKDDE